MTLIIFIRTTLIICAFLALVYFGGVLLFPRETTQVQIFVTKHLGVANPISYQRLTTHADLFNDKLIRVKAGIYQDKTGIFLFDEKHIVFEDVIEVDSEKIILNDEEQNWLKEIFNDTSIELPQLRKSAAIFTGWFNGNVTPGCYAPKHRLTIIKIEQVGKISIGVEKGK